MRIANVIPPTWLDPLIGDEEGEDYHLVLAELFLHQHSWRYTSFYRQRITRGDFVILDNGAHEYGKTPSLDVLCAAAHMLKPTEIVLPDDMHGENCHITTVQMSREGALRLQKQGFDKFMAVPHGHTFNDWLWCAMELSHIPGVTTLGIAEKDAIKLTGGDRTELIRAITGLGKWIHLLGMMEDMRDVQDRFTRTNPKVRGVDGSKLVVWGHAGLNVRPLESLPPYPGRPEGYFEQSKDQLSPDSSHIIRANMRSWREFISSMHYQGELVV